MDWRPAARRHPRPPRRTGACQAAEHPGGGAAALCSRVTTTRVISCAGRARPVFLPLFFSPLDRRPAGRAAGQGRSRGGTAHWVPSLSLSRCTVDARRPRPAVGGVAGDQRNGGEHPACPPRRLGQGQRDGDAVGAEQKNSRRSPAAVAVTVASRRCSSTGRCPSRPSARSACPLVDRGAGAVAVRGRGSQASRTAGRRPRGQQRGRPSLIATGAGEVVGSGP